MVLGGVISEIFSSLVERVSAPNIFYLKGRLLPAG